MTFIPILTRHGQASSPAGVTASSRRSLHKRRAIYQQSASFLETDLGIFSSNTFIASSESLTTPASSFEPILPDTTALVGFGAVVAISVVAAIVWNTQVVPISRTKLALSKKSGDVKEYLDGLKDDSASDNDRQFEQWLFTDWLERSKTKKDPALPILTKAKWNSGDNPVLAATALIIVGVVISSIIEKLAVSL